MKKILLIILSLFFLYFLINQLFVNTYEGSVFSINIQKSKENGYFLSEYVTDRDSIKLYSGENVLSPSIWSEKGQENSHFLIFFSSKEVKRNSFNYILNSPGICATNKYMLRLSGSYNILNCIKDIGFIYNTDWYSESLTVYFVQPDPVEGWVKESVTDTLIYKIK